MPTRLPSPGLFPAARRGGPIGEFLGVSWMPGMWSVSPSPSPSPARGEGIKGTNRVHGLHADLRRRVDVGKRSSHAGVQLCCSHRQHTHHLLRTPPAVDPLPPARGRDRVRGAFLQFGDARPQKLYPLTPILVPPGERGLKAQTGRMVYTRTSGAGWMWGRGAPMPACSFAVRIVNTLTIFWAPHPQLIPSPQARGRDRVRGLFSSLETPGPRSFSPLTQFLCRQGRGD